VGSELGSEFEVEMRAFDNIEKNSGGFVKNYGLNCLVLNP